MKSSASEPALTGTNGTCTILTERNVWGTFMDLKKELIDPFVSVSLFVELIAQP